MFSPILILLLMLACGAITFCFGSFFSSRFLLINTLFSFFLGTFLSLYFFFSYGLENKIERVFCYTWLKFSNIRIDIGFVFDSLSLTMIVLIMVIATLVQIYSRSYMRQDPYRIRFMSYLSFFTFFMLVLVSSNNFIQLFFGWEGVGLCSYLLISFWFTRVQANKAALKAVIVNKIGDIFLMIGIVLIFNKFSCFDFETIFNLINCSNSDFTESSEIYWICLFLFIGSMAKSAQIGFHSWLPDAMEGPTPVSALIHAATMVTAGVYLMLRCSTFLECCASVRVILIIIGGFTCLFAGIIACAQVDLKKIIAYSTMSQLGYMYMGCGLSCYKETLFHLWVHGYIKALLFLGAGVVIHAMQDQQNIYRMGGLMRYLPSTCLVMLIGSLSLTALPFFSGYYSKDTLLEMMYSSNNLGNFGIIAFIIGAIGSIFTGFYSTKIFLYVFLGKPNGSFRFYKNFNIENDRWLMFPLMILAFGSIILGYPFYLILVDIGSQFFSMVLKIPTNTYQIEAENLSFFIKTLPFTCTFLGFFSCLFFFIDASNNRLTITSFLFLGIWPTKEMFKICIENLKLSFLIYLNKSNLYCAILIHLIIIELQLNFLSDLEKYRKEKNIFFVKKYGEIYLQVLKTRFRKLSRQYYLPRFPHLPILTFPAYIKKSFNKLKFALYPSWRKYGMKIFCYRENWNADISLIEYFIYPKLNLSKIFENIWIMVWNPQNIRLILKYIFISLMKAILFCFLCLINPLAICRDLSNLLYRLRVILNIFFGESVVYIYGGWRWFAKHVNKWHARILHPEEGPKWRELTKIRLISFFMGNFIFDPFSFLFKIIFICCFIWFSPIYLIIGSFIFRYFYEVFVYIKCLLYFIKIEKKKLILPWFLEKLVNDFDWFFYRNEFIRKKFRLFFDKCNKYLPFFNLFLHTLLLIIYFCCLFYFAKIKRISKSKSSEFYSYLISIFIGFDLLFCSNHSHIKKYYNFFDERYMFYQIESLWIARFLELREYRYCHINSYNFGCNYWSEIRLRKKYHMLTVNNFETGLIKMIKKLYIDIPLLFKLWPNKEKFFRAIAIINYWGFRLRSSKKFSSFLAETREEAYQFSFFQFGCTTERRIYFYMKWYRYILEGPEYLVKRYAGWSFEFRLIERAFFIVLRNIFYCKDREKKIFPEGKIVSRINEEYSLLYLSRDCARRIWLDDKIRYSGSKFGFIRFRKNKWKKYEKKGFGLENSKKIYSKVKEAKKSNSVEYFFSSNSDENIFQREINHCNMIEQEYYNLRQILNKRLEDFFVIFLKQGPVRKQFNFLVVFLYKMIARKFYFDKVINILIMRKIFHFSYDIFLKTFDKGLLEYFGPTGIAKSINFFSRWLIKLQSGCFYDYMRLIILFFLFSWFLIFLVKYFCFLL